MPSKMAVYTLSIILFLGVILQSSIATYTTEENIDSSKSTYGAVNSILRENEASHMQEGHTFNEPPSAVSSTNGPGIYFNGPIVPNTATNMPCSVETGCPVPPRRFNGVNDIEQNINTPRLYPIDIDDRATNGAGQIDVRTDPNIGGSAQYYPRFLPINPQAFPPSQGYFPPGQVDPGFARFPPPQQGGPMPNYFPQPQGSYPQPPQWHHGPPPANYGPYAQRQHHPYPYNPDNDYRHHDHDHHRHHDHDHHRHHHHHHPESIAYNTPDHSLTSNTEYTEVGHQENAFQGNSNGLDNSRGYDDTFNRPRY